VGGVLAGQALRGNCYIVAVLAGRTSAATTVTPLVSTATVVAAIVVRATAVVVTGSTVRVLCGPVFWGIAGAVVCSGVAVLTDLLGRFILFGIAATLNAGITIGARFVWAAIDPGIAGGISAGQQGQQQDERYNSH
jgi:hypothetical protein